VKPTDTLWSIASRTYGGDVREGIWKLQQRNHLASSTLQPGQKLVLPAG
jgi:LysM repeat protein